MSSDEVTAQEGPLDLAEEISKNEVAVAPADTADPTMIVEAKIPQDIRDRYEIYSYRNAATILSETRKAEFDDLLTALRDFKITKRMIRTAGGNESDIPKLFSATLRPLDWYETAKFLTRSRSIGFTLGPQQWMRGSTQASSRSNSSS